MVTTKQTPMVNAQNIKRKEYVHIPNETEQNHSKPQSKGAREKGRNRDELQKHTENNEKNDNNYIPTNNYFKCKWTKFSNQKTHSGSVD